MRGNDIEPSDNKFEILEKICDADITTIAMILFKITLTISNLYDH